MFMGKGVSFLLWLRKVFTKNKVFIQRAMSYMTILNSGMIMFLLLSKLQDYGIEIHITKWFFPIFVLSLLAMVLIGFLDYKFGFHREELRAAQAQNPYLVDISKRLENIEKKLK